MSEDIEKSWFVVHTYSGYEHKVKANLESRTQTMGMSQQIFRVLVPEQEVTTIPVSYTHLTLPTICSV